MEATAVSALPSIGVWSNLKSGIVRGGRSVVLTAAGSNFRFILKWLKVLLRLILVAIFDSVTARSVVQPVS